MNPSWLILKSADKHYKMLEICSVSFFTQVIMLLAVLVLPASVHYNPEFYLPVDCDDIYRHDNTTLSGVYTIYPGSPTTPLHVYCDMDTDRGRWTVSILHCSLDFIIINMNKHGQQGLYVFIKKVFIKTYI